MILEILIHVCNLKNYFISLINLSVLSIIIETVVQNTKPKIIKDSKSRKKNKEHSKYICHITL